MKTLKSYNAFRMKALLPPLADAPWEKWERLSEMGRKLETWGKGCGHSCFQVPFSHEFMLK